MSEGIPCPFCGSIDTDFLSLFGQQLLTVQYYCNACRTPFERVKDRDVLVDATRHAEQELEVDHRWLLAEDCCVVSSKSIIGCRVPIGLRRRAPPGKQDPKARVFDIAR